MSQFARNFLGVCCACSSVSPAVAGETAVDTRAALTRGTVAVEIMRYESSGGPPTLVQQWETQWSGDRVRCEFVMPDLRRAPDPAGAGPADGARDLFLASGLTFKTVLTPDAVFRHHDVGRLPTEQPLVARVDALSDDNWEEDGKAVFDPRLLGLRPGPPSHLRGERLSEYVRLFGGRTPQLTPVEQTAVVGDATSAVNAAPDSDTYEFRFGSGVETALTVDLDRGGQIVSGVTRLSPTLEDRMLVDLQRWGAGGMWFPRRVTVERVEDGVVLFREEATVTRADFVTLPPPDRFGLAGLDLPPGTRVIRRLPQTHEGGVWDGEQLIPVITSDGVAADGVPDWAWWASAAATALSVLLLAAARR